MKIAVKVRLFLLILAMVIIVGMYLLFEYLVIPEHIQALENESWNCAYELQETFQYLDIQEKEQVIRELSSSRKDLTYILLLDRNGKAIIHSNPDREGMYFDDPVTMMAARDAKEGRQVYIRDNDKPDSTFYRERVLDILVPCYDQNGEHYGAINIGISFKHLDEVKKRYYYFIALGGICLLLIVWVAGIKFFNEIIIPIEEIYQATIKGRQLDSINDEDVESADEIGILGEEFTLMAQQTSSLLDDLKKREKELQDYINHLVSINGKLAPDGTIMVLNKGIEKYLDNGRINLLGQKVWDCPVKGVQDEDRTRLKEMINAVSTGLTILSEEFSIYNQGSLFTFNVILRSVRDEKGKTAYLVIEAFDISEAKKTAEALANSETKLIKQVNYLNILINNINEVFYTHDLNGCLTFANKKFLKFTGYKADSFPGMQINDIIPAFQQQKINIELENRLEKGMNRSYEINALIRDGSERLFRVNSAPIIEEGRIIGGMVLATDITMQRQAEEKLRHAHNELEMRVRERTDELQKTNDMLKMQIIERERIEEALLDSDDKLRQQLNYLNTLKDNLNELFYIYNKDAIISFVNKKCLEVLGYLPEELIGRDISILVPERDKEVQRKQINNRLIKGVSGSYEISFLHRDGSERIIQVNSSPIVEEGLITGGIMLCEDITDKKRMSEELLKASKLESLGVLAGGIAHDFNNLLTVIVGNLALTKMMLCEQEELMELLTEAEKASFQAKGLTQQLLTFARGGAPIRETASINDLIRESSRFALSGSNVSCKYNIANDLWPVDIDRGQMSQVINNLIINAVQAMPDGGKIKIDAQNIQVFDDQVLGLPGGKFVLISIQDQGRGIKEELYSRIFDPYFTTKETGSGLGLATSYSIIRKHSGYITLKSRIGEGTTFYIYLPASERELEVKCSKDTVAIPGKGKILLMDDEKRITEVAGQILDSIGYEVEQAHEGQETIFKYKKSIDAGRKFDLIIMDLTVPGGMGGKETIEELLKIDPKVRVIVSSGYANDPIMADYEHWGFKGVIVKPYGVKELSETIARVINQSI